MGHQWESTNSQDIWEKEITQKVPHVEKIHYHLLDGDGIRCEKLKDLPVEEKIATPEGIHRPLIQRILCSHCEGMEKVLKKMCPENHEGVD